MGGAKNVDDEKEEEWKERIMWMKRRKRHERRE